MYNFVDVDEGAASCSLPSEAMKINGKYIENEIEGYRTLYVLGRELTEEEITELQIGMIDGAEYRGRRTVSRTITVGYQLLSDTPEQFRARFNQLNAILRQEEAEIIFADEPDKYFIGTKSNAGDVPEGRLNVTGEFSIYCCDPRKYSTVEKTFQASVNDEGILEATIENDGTEAVPISYEITHNHDNGYIGIATSRGAIQIGNKQEADGENYKQNETLIDGLSEIKNAPDDHGVNYLFPERDTGGSLSYMSDEDAIVLGSMGDGTSGKWCGGLRTIELPADSEGDVGASNFWCYMNWWFQTGLMGQTGEQTIAFLTSDNKVICGYRLAKWDMSGNSAAMECWINGKKVEDRYFYPTGNENDNPFNEPRGNQDITKEGDSIRFYWNGVYFSRSDPEIKDMVCTKIQIGFSQYYGRDLNPWGQYVTRNYLRRVIFQKMYVEKWKDVPNKYSSGDVVEIDGNARKIYKNGINVTSDEIVGSNYPDAPPGGSKVEFYFSDFSIPEPTVVARIREAYI